MLRATLLAVLAGACLQLGPVEARSADPIPPVAPWLSDAEALALLDELLEAKPNDLFCHKARASALQGLNREEDAVIALETLRRMNKLDSAGTLSLGDLYHNLGLHDLSLAAYQQALAKKEKLSLSRYARGLALRSRLPVLTVRRFVFAILFWFLIFCILK